MIKYYKNYIPKELCERVISVLNNDEKLKDAITAFPDTDDSYLDTSFNKRKLLPVFDTSVPELKEITNLLIKLFEIEIKSFKLEVTDFLYVFNKYNEGDFLNYHTDKMHIKDGNKPFTMVIELNTEYEGGEFCYMVTSSEEVCERSVGGVFIFDIFTEHKVNMVTGGQRFSLNCWPKFKKNKVLL